MGFIITSQANSLVGIQDEATGTRVKSFLARGYLQTPSQTSSSFIVIQLNSTIFYLKTLSCYIKNSLLRLMISHPRQDYIQAQPRQYLCDDVRLRHTPKRVLLPTQHPTEQAALCTFS